MTSKDFEEMCKIEVVKKLREKCSAYTEEDVHLVWFGKALQNFKCVLVVAGSPLRICECTYNGDKNQLYIDIYQKEYNTCIDLV